MTNVLVGKGNIRKLYTPQNRMLIGEFVKDVDGFFYFWANKTLSGCTCSLFHKEVAAVLDELNAEWQATIDADPRVNGQGS